MKRILALLVFVFLAPLPAFAQGVTVYEFDGTYEDATFGVENGIIDRGLVVDWVSKVGEMLNRTARDVGATQKVYEQAQVFQFCSAIVSRTMMEADPLNIAYCPYSIFVAQPADGSGKVLIGYRNQPEGEMQEVQALLEGIVRDAMEF